MLSKINSSIVILLIRIAFGTRIIYGVVDNILSWDQMLAFEKFLETNHFPLPLVSAITSVYLQFISGICWVIGYKVKIASFIMMLNFLVAIIGFHIIQGDSYLNMAPAIHLFVISIFLLVMGPGKYAIDKREG